MTLQVIGAGFGRTGTLSLKSALEQLGFAPCYHMMEVIQHPEYADMWQPAVDGEAVDWDTIFDGYTATVDWPAAYFWRELVSYYPEAKVLLTVRDAERWYESIRNTIFQAMKMMPQGNVPVASRWSVIREIVLNKTFGERLEDRAYAIRVYEQHIEEVQRSIPAHHLLVYEVTQGWEPLCQFLERPVPTEPFPRTNSTQEFQARVTAARRAASDID